MKTFALLLITTLLTGCATELKTFKEDGTASLGIPIPKPMLVKITTTTKFKAITNAANPELCTEDKIVESYDYVTSGEYYYANFDPSEFANGAFEVNFNEKGLPSKISVNSEANTGVESISGLLGTLMPYYKAPKVDDSAKSGSTSARLASNSMTSAEDLKAASCLEKTQSIKLTPISITKINSSQ